MRLDALTEEGKTFLRYFKQIKGFYLAGGTALALQLGHRVSVDFDFFNDKEIKRNLLDEIEKIFVGFQIKNLVNNKNELTIVIGNTKVTFLFYPFSLLFSMVPSNNINLASIDEIASMKAYTIGRRGTFKDYVDIYFILKSGVFLKNVIESADKKYGEAFNSRLFLEQLIYFDDLEDKEIKFIGEAVSEEVILAYFKEEIKKITL